MHVRIVLHAPRRTHKSQHVQRHEGEIEAEEPAPEHRFAEPLIQRETEGLGKPITDARHDTEDNSTNRYIMKVRNQEQTVVQNKVRRWDRHEDTGHSPDDEGHHEPDGPVDRYGEADAAA